MHYYRCVYGTQHKLQMEIDGPTDSLDRCNIVVNVYTIRRSNKAAAGNYDALMDCDRPRPQARQLHCAQARSKIFTRMAVVYGCKRTYLYR